MPSVVLWTALHERGMPLGWASARPPFWAGTFPAGRSEKQGCPDASLQQPQPGVAAAGQHVDDTIAEPGAADGGVVTTPPRLTHPPHDVPVRVLVEMPLLSSRIATVRAPVAGSIDRPGPTPVSPPTVVQDQPEPVRVAR
jgi:hypothetical protein